MSKHEHPNQFALDPPPLAYISRIASDLFGDDR